MALLNIILALKMNPNIIFHLLNTEYQPEIFQAHNLYLLSLDFKNACICSLIIFNLALLVNIFDISIQLNYLCSVLKMF